MDRVRRWLSQRSSTSATGRLDGQLREFIYLDDVSVYSLIASLRGAIPTEFTEREARGLSSELDSSVEGTAGIAKGRLGASTATTRDTSSQVVRRSIVQSAFKELFELAAKRVVLYPPVGEPPAVERAEQLHDSVKSGWAIEPSSLSRGQLVEVEVALDADVTFRVSAVVSAYLEILQEDLEVFGVRMPSEIATVRAMNRLLDRMLAGLVPIRGTATEWKVIAAGGKELIVHNNLLDQITDRSGMNERPLVVVGVAEQRLFWKDIRRSLFSGAPYRLYARISQSGLQDTWSPVKIVDVLKQAAPGIDSQFMEAFGRFPFGNASTQPQMNSASQEHEAIRLAAQSFLGALAEYHSVVLTGSDQDAISAPAIVGNHTLDTVDGRRVFYNDLLGSFEAATGVETPREIVVGCRTLATAEAGLGFGGSLAPTSAPTQAELSLGASERFLDTEPVAIYW